MDNQKKLAITAISDAQGEGFITASLERQGWQVIYRALAHQELIQFFDSINNQVVTLFTSSDFASLSASLINNQWPHINTIVLDVIPTNDHDFSEIIRGGTEVKSHNWAKVPSIPILTFTSFGRSVGTSTIALNIAAELAEMGSEVLLVEAECP